MVDEFARLGVDPCGERGEYHTAVTNSPLFSAPIEVVHGERVFRSGCHAMDILISRQAAVGGQRSSAGRQQSADVSRSRQSDAAR
jgi:diphthamide synthase (EF-2-diphthine--ammonia ligase)